MLAASCLSLRRHGVGVAAFTVLFFSLYAWSAGWQAGTASFPSGPGGKEVRVVVEATAGAFAPAAAPCVPDEPTFFAASNNETDKVTLHHYQHAYQAHIAPRRCAMESFLEIGLGCAMSYGGGKSVRLWLNYLPRARVSVMEYFQGCATDFAQTNPLHIPQHQLQRLRVFWGDQSVPAHLLAVAAASGPYDAIVDDGGHTMKQQLVTLATLLPLVKPGGLYIVEDLGTSSPGSSEYQRDREIQWTMVEYINAMVSGKPVW